MKMVGFCEMSILYYFQPSFYRHIKLIYIFMVACGSEFFDLNDVALQFYHVNKL